MKAERKTKAQLIQELEDLHRRVAELEKSEIERKRAEKTPGESEEHFRILYERAPLGYQSLNVEGCLIEVNQSWLDLLGYAREEVIGRWFGDFLAPQEVEAFKQRFPNFKAKGEVHIDLTMVQRAGSKIIVHIDGRIGYDEHGRFRQTHCILHDINERKGMEEVIRQSEERYRTVIEEIDEGYYEVDLAGNFTFVNDSMIRQLQYSREELIGMNYRTYIPREELEGVYKTFNRAYRTGETIKWYPVTNIRKDGTPIFLEDSISCRRDREDRIVGFRGISLNVTERKRAEELLLASEERFKAQYQGSPIPTFTWQKKGETFKLVDYNQAAKVVSQGEALKYLGKTAAEMYQDRQEILQDIHRCFTEKEVIKRELQSHHFMPGRAMIATYAFVPPDLIIVHAEDITERKQLEEALRGSEEKFRNVFDNSSIGMSMTSIDGSVYVNQCLSEMLGYRKEELSGLKWQDFTHPDDIELTQENLEQLLSGERTFVRFNKRYIKKDGSTLWGDLNTVLQKDKNGNPLYYISGLVDITERSRWEALVERTMRETRIRFEVSQALAGKETEDEVLDALIQKAGFYPQAYVAICTIDRQAEERAIILRRADSFESGVATIVPIGTRFPSSRFMSLNRYPIDQPFVSNDIGNDERIDLASHELIHQTGVTSLAFFPLTIGKEWMGFIVNLAKPGHYFDQGKQHLYQTLAEQGAVALRAAYLRGQIRESQKRFRDLVETLNDWIWEVNQDGVYTYVSPKIRDLLGFEPEELLGKTPFDLMPSEEAQRVSGIFEPLKAARQPLITLENNCRHKDGRLVVFETSGMPFFDGEGQFRGYRGIDRDITERKQAEEALYQAEEKYRALVENAVEGIFQSTSDWEFLMANTAVAKFHGYDSPEELIAEISNIGEQLYVHPEDRQRYRRLLADEGIVKGFEAQFYSKDGTIRWGSMNVRSVRDKEGRLLRYEGTIEDITTRKEAEEGLQKSLEKLRKAMGGIIQAMALTVETRDPYTAGHQRRVTDLARAIAQEMGLPEDQVDGIRMSGIVHDIGKIAVPAEILSKPTQLTDIEFKLIMVHPQIGYDILKDIDFTWPVAQIVLQHHERINGSGYPLGLSGEAIHLEARILAVADVVEAIASHRPYRPAYGIEVALEEISKNQGILYDPGVVDACLRLFREKGFKFE